MVRKSKQVQRILAMFGREKVASFLLTILDLSKGVLYFWSFKAA